jgi:hypothetical protein
VLGQVGLGLTALGEEHLVRVGDEAAAHGVSFLGGNRLTRLLSRCAPPATPGRTASGEFGVPAAS